MAFKRGGSKRPQFSISTSVFVRKGKYIKGPSFGLWDADSPVVARGSVKEDYLAELAEFLQKAVDKDLSVSFALFKNKKQRDEEEEEEDDEKEERRGKRGKRSRDEEEEEEDEKEEKRGKKTGKKSGKKDDWDFDD
jgi:hypothetical protein